jgi:hypothetical protein
VVYFKVAQQVSNKKTFWIEFDEKSGIEVGTFSSSSLYPSLIIVVALFHPHLSTPSAQ